FVATQVGRTASGVARAVNDFGLFSAEDLGPAGAVRQRVLLTEVDAMHSIVTFNPVNKEPLESPSGDSPSQGPANSLLYHRPSYSGEARLFFDLVAYCPGLNTSAADLRAVLEAEAAPGAASKPGVIEPAARALLDGTRPAGWRALTLPG